MLEYALKYANLGWPVFPLRPAAKGPFRGFNWIDCASSDPENVGLMWNGRSGSKPLNIAVVCLHFLVIDIDPLRGGSDTMRRLISEHGKLPRTPVARTGSGGWHYLFIRRESPHRGTLGEGVDVLNSGCYFVAPPSSHPNGKSYRWLVSPADAEIAVCPEWVADMISVQPKTGSSNLRARSDPKTGSSNLRASMYAAELPPAVSGQNGHTAAFVACKKLLSVFADITDEQMFHALQDWNARCDPPWSDNELMRKIREARK